MSLPSSGLNSSNLPSFRWVRSGFPIYLRTTGFFFYAALILFFGFDIIPNFLPVSEVAFNVGGIALVFLVDFIWTRFLSRQRELGTICFDADRIRVASADGSPDRELKYEQVRNLHIQEGTPLSLFQFLSEKRTVTLEIVLKDLTRIKLETVKKALEANRPDLAETVDQLQDRIGIPAQTGQKRR